MARAILNQGHLFRLEFDSGGIGPRDSKCSEDLRGTQGNGRHNGAAGDRGGPHVKRTSSIGTKRNKTWPSVIALLRVRKGDAYLGTSEDYSRGAHRCRFWRCNHCLEEKIGIYKYKKRGSQQSTSCACDNRSQPIPPARFGNWLCPSHNTNPPSPQPNEIYLK